jgi:3-oxosteroid 1-dehydrogenase
MNKDRYMNHDWDKIVDIVVVGSGAGGLLTALVAAKNRAEVLIVEKDRAWGGTSATSGGGIWIPGSDQAKEAGFEDDLDDAFTYLRALSADNVPDENIRAYVDNAAEMLRWMTANTQVRYLAQPYPDYHAENKGGSPTGYRTHLPLEFDGRLLGDCVRTQRFPSPAASLFGYLQWTFAETYQLLYRTKGWFTHLCVNMAKYWFDWPFRFRSRKDRRLTLGNALTGALRHALNEERVPLWLSTPMRELVREGGRIIGVVVERDGRLFRVGVRKGVVLAAGGFDKDKAMREANAPLYPDARLSGGVTSNTGDAIRSGAAVGAATMNLQSAWAAPVFYVPGEDRGRLSTIERALPGCIMVSQKGERFLNEAASYHITGQLMARRQRDHGDASPSWMIFDRRFRHLYPMGALLPLVPDWAQSRGVRATVKKAASVEELAHRIGADPLVLAATIERFNTYAAKGDDPDFHRGEAAYDRMYGDQRNTPNPCLRPLDQGPYYAMPIYPGDIGTNGGLVTNARAQVLDIGGQAIAGLYAIGNNAASVMGESYPGAGVTLGPALTFGYIAARDMTGGNV